MKNSMRRVAHGVALAAALGLAACSPASEESGEAVEAQDGKSLTAAVGDAQGLDTISDALGKTGLDGIFVDAGSYTLLAPDDAAFGALGADGEALTSAEDSAALAALLRDHIVPGYVTPKDIAAALDSSGDGKVRMRTMGETTITFSKAGSDIIATGEDGSQARLDADPITAGANSAIRVNGLLKKV